MKISIRKVKKVFNDRVLFNDLSFEIAQGQMTCLFGPSGCGKTTLLNMIGGIESMDGGMIYYDDQPLKGLKLNKLLAKNIGFIFQNFGLVENMTVLQNMKMIKRVSRLNSQSQKQLINDCLDQVKMSDFLNSKIYTLSGGEQQRIAIAKIIAKDCDVILADEPTASLDENNRMIVINWLKQLRDANKTIVIVSHDHRIRDLCDQVIELSSGYPKSI